MVDDWANLSTRGGGASLPLLLPQDHVVHHKPSKNTTTTTTFEQPQSRVPNPRANVQRMANTTFAVSMMVISGPGR